MPFLTEVEFKEKVGNELARMAIGTGPKAWESAVKSAGVRVTSITGLPDPPNVANAPEWAKEPCAFIILYLRAGRKGSVDKDTRIWMKEMFTLALKDLESNRLSLKEKNKILHPSDPDWDQPEENRNPRRRRGPNAIQDTLEW